MRLLVKRDKTVLSVVEGKAIVDNVPDFLKIPRAVPADLVRAMEPRTNDDLLIATDANASAFIAPYLAEFDKLYKSDFSSPSLLKKAYAVFGKRFENVPAFWSGYRSTLFQDPETNRLFRLKGVSLNPSNPQIVQLPDGSSRIEGGQKEQDAEWERDMSNKFNSVLVHAGIKPIMQYRGMWRYPVPAKGSNLAASIYEVEGDTRLDELMVILESFCDSKTPFAGLNVQQQKSLMSEIESGRKVWHTTKQNKDFLTRIEKFYFELGFATGQLKQLMEVNDQTWSGGVNNTNAHIGNIVVYRDARKIHLGLVDFDASFDAGVLSKSALRDIQRVEYQSLQNSVFRLISMRQINGKFSFRVMPEIREYFLRGFSTGYTGRLLSTPAEVDSSLFEEMVDLLRAPQEFSFISTPRSFSEEVYHSLLDRLYSRKGDYNTTSTLEDVIYNNSRYQNSILDNLYGRSKIKEDISDKYTSKLSSYI